MSNIKMFNTLCSIMCNGYRLELIQYGCYKNAYRFYNGDKLERTLYDVPMKPIQAMGTIMLDCIEASENGWEYTREYM